MKGFLLGISLASICWVGGYYAYQHRKVEHTEPVATEVPPEAKEDKRTRRSRRRGGGLRVNEVGGPAEVQEPPERKLTAAELRITGKGDDLSRADVVQIDMGAADPLPELSEADIDDRFRARQSAVLDCIEKARPDSMTYVPGRVTVQFRIQKTGAIRGVRVEAPSILQQGGLYPCVKDVVMSIKFPASNGSQVVTFPFELS